MAQWQVAAQLSLFIVNFRMIGKCFPSILFDTDVLSEHSLNPFEWQQDHWISQRQGSRILTYLHKKELKSNVVQVILPVELVKVPL